MTKRDASTVLALLNHLTGAHTYDETDLLTNLVDLHASAATALPDGALPLDEDALLDTLCEVGQRHADSGWYDDEPNIETVEVRDRL